MLLSTAPAQVENLVIGRFEDLLWPKGSGNPIQAYKHVLWLHTTDVTGVWYLNTSSFSVACHYLVTTNPQISQKEDFQLVRARWTATLKDDVFMPQTPATSVVGNHRTCLYAWMGFLATIWSQQILKSRQKKIFNLYGRGGQQHWRMMYSGSKPQLRRL